MPTAEAGPPGRRKPGRRCDLGCQDVNWPDKPIYWRCPYCGGPTTVYSNTPPIPEEEANSIYSHIEFETYYERYCARLGQSVDGALPES